MSRLQEYCCNFPFLEIRDKNVYCSCCDQNIAPKISNIKVHLETTKHIKNIEQKKTQSEFNMDLTNFMIAANIPWVQLQNKNFRSFIKKCIDGEYAKTVSLPTEANLRLRYLPKMFQNAFTLILSV